MRLLLVRHGQASFGAANYDQLSPLGERQCQAVGEHLVQQGWRFAAVYRGSLARHEQSLAAMVHGARNALAAGGSTRPAVAALVEPPVQIRPALNEYDSEALLAALAQQALPGLEWPKPGSDPHVPEVRRAHFRLLRRALLGWMSGELLVPRMPTWKAFEAGVVAVLGEICQRHAQGPEAGDVLLVSSGGPISTAIAHTLFAPAATVVELNLQMRNASLHEMSFHARRATMVSYNGLPHLATPERASWVTAA